MISFPPHSPPQQIRALLKDSGCIFRKTAALLSAPLGFSETTGSLFLRLMDVLNLIAGKFRISARFPRR